MSLNLLSLNVNGIIDSKKRNTIFHWLKEQNADIILLQETHCNSKLEEEAWSEEWGGNAIWSLGTNFSKGVAVLFKPNLDLNYREIEIDQDGRFIILHCEIEDLNLVLVNIYSPNHALEREVFFKHLLTKIKQLKCENCELVIGGDYNCTLNAKLDRRHERSPDKICADRGQKDLMDLIINLELKEVWRRRYPGLSRYTYFRKNCRSASRIDFWLISTSLDPYVQKCGIKQAVRSDHTSVNLILKTSEVERGPGIWKMNKKCLESLEFQNLFETFLGNLEKRVQ